MIVNQTQIESDNKNLRMESEKPPESPENPSVPVFPSCVSPPPSLLLRLSERVGERECGRPRVRERARGCVAVGLNFSPPPPPNDDGEPEEMTYAYDEAGQERYSISSIYLLSYTTFV
jgi:hypothetical protein